MTISAQKSYDTKEAAKILGLSPNTLSQWRNLKRGPKFRKYEKAVRYLESDLLEYIEQKSRSATSRRNLQTY